MNLPSEVIARQIHPGEGEEAGLSATDFGTRPKRSVRMWLSTPFLLIAVLVNAASTEGDLTIQLPATAHFVAAHGRRAWAGGYANGGLEVWTGALQIASDIRPEFRRQGDVSPISGAQILATVAAHPAYVSRTYIGPDFSVDEEISVPLEQPAVLVRYTVRGNPVAISVRFHPSLNLMWPAALGGLDIRWDGAHSGYLFTEPSKEFSAAVLAPGAAAHDEPLKDARLSQPGLSKQSESKQSEELAITLNQQSPQIVFAQLKTPPGDSLAESDSAALQGLLGSLQWQQNSIQHYDDLLTSNLQIETPDQDLNRAFAWAEIDLDQDWLCNDPLGCGYVGGFGPSRRDRRPQYAWFFAGDGMIGAQAAMASGDLERARQEILFIAKYQDTKTGMIWHELSQSAPYLDWRGKYPFMFVHADLTSPYISTAADYVRQSNDREFMREIWPSVQKAFAYARSLLGDDGLPRIPQGKEGGDEQDSLSDELGLSAAWIAACDDYKFLVRLAGDASLIPEMDRLRERARVAFNTRYWNAHDNYAIQGYKRDGTPVADRGLGAIRAVKAQLFDEARRQHILDEIASWSFQSDWGTRGVAMGEAGFNPTGYAHGSVSALHTADVAEAYWMAHRPETAFEIWRTLIPWFWLDSPGHMHEVLRGDVYYPQSESVPEQMWSSAGFLSAAVRGLFGLNINAVNRSLELAPHLPANWEHAALHNVKIGNSKLSFVLDQSLDGLTVHIDNMGDPVHLLYSPAIPLGARDVTATADDKNIEVRVAAHLQDEHARVEFEVPRGKSEIKLHYDDGVGIILPPSHPIVGQPSQMLKLTSLALDGNALRLTVDMASPKGSTIEDNIIKLRTKRTIQKASNCVFSKLSNGYYELTIFPTSTETALGYHREQVDVTFAARE
jgi:glycogen debranching enzyme